MKPHFPEADRDFIRKRLQSLRGTFRKEMNKVTQSKRSGKGADEVYVPTLWYYEKMLFTLDQETPSASTSNIDNDAGPSFLEESSEVDGNHTSTNNFDDAAASTNNLEDAAASTNNLEDAEALIIEKDPAESETQPDRVSLFVYFIIITNTGQKYQICSKIIECRAESKEETEFLMNNILLTILQWTQLITIDYSVHYNYKVIKFHHIEQ